MQRHGGMDQAWLAPIPAFPQRGKESKPEGKSLTSPTLTPALSRKRERELIPNS